MDAARVTLSDKVRQALSDNRPVVALESTIISHGMPWPKNVETALRVEQAVQDAGATPATIAILDGQLRAGLSQDQIERLGKTGTDANKISRRDMAFAVSDPDCVGATTVASTMIVAALAGIRVFATGGIGGVHRGASESFDISADLQELARTDVAVVCAGAKSILDIGLTQEYLETHGVPVVGFDTDYWPAFYTRSSEFAVDYNLNDPIAIAAVLRRKWDLGLSGGVLICVPVPAEHSLDEAFMESLITDAIARMDQQGISGKNATPFLLAEIARVTEGQSLATNIELVVNNAITGANIACALADVT